MSDIGHSIRRVFTGRRAASAEAQAAPEAVEIRSPADANESTPIDIAPNDPIIAFFQSAPGAVDIDGLELDSPALESLRANGVKLVVPLVTQGELIGLLNLGPRMSDQEYSGDDRRLLESLAAQAAPAVRVGQLVREQEAEIRSRERLEQELQVAKLIQQNFLPRHVPELPGWKVAADYRPAREVGGDFYDFIDLPDGRLGLVIGDVTDKGVPAALVMAATRSVLRASAQRLIEPGEVLARVNEHLCPDIPENMFVTCLYGVLEPETGRLVFANAGHNLPVVCNDGVVTELRARGMPLGLMPGMAYEEVEAVLAPGAELLLYSDGLVEAHDPSREMFGSQRLATLMASGNGGTQLIADLLGALGSFAGEHSEQEDDITLVAIGRAAVDRGVLAEFGVPSAPGNERDAIRQVVAALPDGALEPARLERLKTAVGEATMNAMEHGNRFQPELEVRVQVAMTDDAVRVRITDQGGTRPIGDAPAPDLDAKLAGEQTPRGWGLFLIRNMVDEMHVGGDSDHHVVDLVVRREGGSHDNDA
jgi:serine phosphatase RsbU (regulator of sigma subunit)/anti-sigma regulatory factor (Ser/Thr protein kinase)